MAKFNADAYKKLLESKIKETIPKILEEDVAPTIKDAVRYEIKKNVYDSYSPILYKRRDGNGGLLDSDNIQTNVDGMRLSARIITSPNESLFGTSITGNPMLIDWMDEGSIPILPGVKSAPWIDQRRNIKQTITNGIFKSYLRIRIISGLYKRL